MVSIRLLKESHPAHYRFDEHTKPVISAEVLEESGKYPLEDGRFLDVTFNFKFHPARVTIWCVNIPELQGKKRKGNRTVQIGADGRGRTRVSDDTVLEVDLGRAVEPTPEAYSATVSKVRAGQAARRILYPDTFRMPE